MAGNEPVRLGTYGSSGRAEDMILTILLLAEPKSNASQ